uniref:Uncharacterized protein n=1 Tax=viral metagenome TaxID=1070528 RepID=A0A6C0D5A0_9ZZZZ
MTFIINIYILINKPYIFSIFILLLLFNYL